MSVALKVFSEGSLTNAVAVKYTCPTTAEAAIIDKLTCTNYTGGAVTVTIHIVPSGGSALTPNKIIDALSIGANTCRDMTELQNQILGPGETIQALAGALNSISLRASGREFT